MLPESRLRLGCLAALLPGSTACSSTPRLNIVPAGQPIALSDSTGTDSQSVAFVNRAIGKDSDRGERGGLVAGAALGLSCGPFAWFCAPLGAVGGAVVGGIGGAIVGGARGLKNDDKQAIEVRIDGYLSDNPPSGCLLRAVSQRLTGDWTLVEPPAPNRVEVSLRGLALHSKGKSKASLAVKVAVVVTTTAENGDARQRTRLFEYLSPPSHVNSWMEDQNDFVALRFMDAYRTLAENIAIALRPTGSRRGTAPDFRPAERRSGEVSQCMT